MGKFTNELSLKKINPNLYFLLFNMTRDFGDDRVPPPPGPYRFLDANIKCKSIAK